MCNSGIDVPMPVDKTGPDKTRKGVYDSPNFYEGLRVGGGG